MQIDLTGKIILITGASRGIGKAIAEQLANSGATIAIHYNQQKQAAEQLARDIGNKSGIFKADLTREKGDDETKKDISKRKRHSVF